LNKAYKKLRLLFFRELIKSKNPKKLSITLGMGMCLGVVPIPGFSSVLCILISSVLRLRVTLVLSVHWLMFPIQILLYPLLISASIWILGIPIGFDNVNSINKILSLQKDILYVHILATILWLILSIIFFILAYNLLFKASKRLLKIKKLQ